MRDINKITTEQLREAYCGLLVQTGDHTFEFIDQDTANAEFDYWLVRERNRVAEMAKDRERERIYKLIEDIAEEVYKIPGVFELTQRELLLYTVILLKEIRDN